MTFIIRYNTNTGSMAIYTNKDAAGDDMPTYSSEAALATGKASIQELARFYNKLVPADKAVKVFKDKPTAARRVWAAATAKVAGEPVPGDDQADKAPEAPATAPSVPATTPAAEKGKRGRRPGTGKFAGKTIYPKCRKNPRRNGVKGWHSYEIILGKTEGVSYEDYVARGGRPQDLQWDLDRKWVEVK